MINFIKFWWIVWRHRNDPPAPDLGRTKGKWKGLNNNGEV